jgi:hypothetical protein
MGENLNYASMLPSHEKSPAEMTPQELDAAVRAKIAAANANAAKSAKREQYDRTTVVAFGLLFVLPAIIIVFSLLFILPLIARSVGQDSSDVTTIRNNSGKIAPESK